MGSLLAALGQAAAIILGIYLFISIILGLVLAAVLMFGFSWIREKSEQLNKIRLHLNDLNRSLKEAQNGIYQPETTTDNKVVQTLARVPALASQMPGKASQIEQNIEQKSDRVASAVIEFQARSAMVKRMARAFFIPQTLRSRQIVVVEKATELVPEPLTQSPAQVQREEPPRYEEEMIIIQSRS